MIIVIIRLNFLYFPATSKDPPTWSVAVCGPALYYYNEDFSDRLIEWLETLRAMGVAKVFLYETDVAPTLSQVLRHYEQDGLVSTLPYSYPPPYPNHPATRWFVWPLFWFFASFGSVDFDLGWCFVMVVRGGKRKGDVKNSYILLLLILMKLLMIDFIFSTFSPFPFSTSFFPPPSLPSFSPSFSGYGDTSNPKITSAKRTSTSATAC